MMILNLGNLIPVFSGDQDGEEKNINPPISQFYPPIAILAGAACGSHREATSELKPGTKLPPPAPPCAEHVGDHRPDRDAQAADDERGNGSAFRQRAAHKVPGASQPRVNAEWKACTERRRMKIHFE